MGNRWGLWATVVVFVSVPTWAAARFGLIEVRACAPQGTLLEGHVAVLRPDAQCYSGVAYDGGALALVGTVAFATLLAWGTGVGVVAAVGAMVALAVQRLAALLTGSRTFALLRHVPVVIARHARAVVTTGVPAGRPHWVSLAVVGWRGPPVAA